MISKSVNSDGVKIVYYICGSGERKLLLLHGNAEDHTIFSRLCRDLQGDFTIIMPDSRGHGSSAGDVKDLTIAAMVRDTELILKEEAPEGACAIGFSDGGNILLGVMARGLAKIDSAALLGANMRPDGLRPDVRVRDAAGYIANTLVSCFSKRARKKCALLGLMLFEPNFIAEEFSGADCPVLVMGGEKDMIKEEHTREIAAAFKNSRICIIKNAGHFLLESAYDSTLSHLREFFSVK